MQTRKLGTRGPKVTTIGFGAWAIGGMNWGKTDDAVSKQALHSALDSGVTLIDTADIYGFGHSEELIAQVLRERGGKGDITIATKAGSDFYKAKTTDEAKPNYTKQHILFAAEQSLKRLGLDCLDILQLHSPAMELLERDEPWDALRTLKQQGKIRQGGLSIRSFDETVQAPLLDEHNDILDVIQVRYNLLEREAEKVLFPKAMKYGIGVIVRIPLLFGLLAGKFTTGSRFSEDDHRSVNLSPAKLDDYLSRLEAMKPFFDKFPDQSMAQTSLRFCITHPACSTAIPGAKTPTQVSENVSASELGALPQEAVAQLGPV